MDTNKIREALNAAHGYVEYQYRRAIEGLDDRAIDGARLDLGIINAALAELDRMDAAPKVLADEAIESIAMKCCPGDSSQIMQATVPNGPIPLSQGENIRRHMVMALRYARDNSYFAPAPGLTVEEMVEIFDGVVRLDSQGELVLRARLTAALEAKTRTA